MTTCDRCHAPAIAPCCPDHRVQLCADHTWRHNNPGKPVPLRRVSRLAPGPVIEEEEVSAA